MRICGFLSCLLACPFLGCAIHPDTQDFSRDMVADIVFHVQCEAKRAITNALAREYLRGALHDVVASDARLQNSAFDQIIPIDEIDEFAAHLEKTALNLNFRFITTEDDDLTTTGSVKVPISQGSFTIGWDAGAEKQRKTDQVVRFTDSFGQLEAQNCSPESPRRNFVYPVTGHIGLQATFDNFVRIAAQQRGEGNLIFNDEITFTTRLIGAVNPSVVLVPDLGRLIQASATALAAREDLHRLTLTFKQVRTIAQEHARLDAKNEEREKELEFIRSQHRIPQRVQLVTNKPNEVIIPLGVYRDLSETQRKELLEGRGPAIGFTAEKVEDISLPPVRAPSTEQLIRGTKREAERDFIIEDTLRTQQEILDRIDR